MGKIKNILSASYAWKYMIPVCIVLISCRSFQMNADVLGQMHGGGIRLSVVDYMIEFYKGAMPYVWSVQTPFNIPVLWSLYFICFFAVTGKRITSCFSKYAQQILLRRNTRGQWWRHCMAGVFLDSAAYIAVSWLGFLAFGIVSGAEMWGIHGRFHQEYNGLMLDGINATGLVLGMGLLSLFVLNAIASVQCVLSIKLNAVIGFAVAVVVLVSSVFFRSPFLIFNCVMLTRYDRFIGSGVNAAECLAVCMILIAVMLHIGDRIIKKKDFF